MYGFNSLALGQDFGLMGGLSSVSLSCRTYLASRILDLLHQSSHERLPMATAMQLGPCIAHCISGRFGPDVAQASYGNPSLQCSLQLGCGLELLSKT